MILTSAHEPGVKVLNCVHEFSKTGSPALHAGAGTSLGGAGRGRAHPGSPTLPAPSAAANTTVVPHSTNITSVPPGPQVQCSQQRGGAPLPGS